MRDVDSTQEEEKESKRKVHLAKQRVRAVIGGTVLLQGIKFCRRWRKCPASLRFMVWVLVWLLFLDYLLPQRLEFSNAAEVQESPREVTLPLPTLPPIEEAAPASVDQELPLPTVPPSENAPAAVEQELPFPTLAPKPAAVNQELPPAAEVQQAITFGAADSIADAEASPEIPPVGQEPLSISLGSLLEDRNLTPAHVKVGPDQLPGDCSTAHDTLSPVTQACCKEAAERLHTAGQMRLEFLRNSRMPFNVQRWWQNLAPSLQRLYKERQEAYVGGRRWTAVAVLLVGQVRDGTRSHVTENIYKYIFKDLLISSIPFHIFAVLEYTRNGFSWRGSRNNTRDFEDDEVRGVLKRYGGNFTLVEWTSEEKKMAEVMLQENCTAGGGRVRALPLQYMKITAAMQLMRKAEEEMGQRFAFVVRIRPDVTYASSLSRLLHGRLQEAKGPVNDSIPSICGSIGGGMGDALLMADRVAAEALDVVAQTVQGCRVPVDECQSWGYLQNECLKVSTLSSGGLIQELCQHGWIPTVLRHGIPTTNCGISGQLGTNR